MQTNIMGIDPGRNTGITILTLVMDEVADKWYPTYMYNYTIVMNSAKPMKDKVVDLRICLTDAMMIFRPSLVAMESAFLNVRFPKAVIVLTEYIQSIKDILYSCDRTIPIINLPPKKVKMLSSGMATADKDDMRLALKNTLLGNLVSDDKLISLSEHEVDSAMIALSGMMWLNQEFTI